MLRPLLLMGLAFTLLFVCLLLVRVKAALLAARLRAAQRLQAQG
jgi:hypothetical protein